MKNSIRSSNAAMPSYWPRRTSVGHRDLRRVDDRQLRAHVDVGAVGHRVVERQDRVGERVDDALLRACPDGRARRSSSTNARSIGRRLLREELGQLLAPLLERRRAFAGPDERVERQPRDALGVALREQRGAQRARRDAVGQEAARRRAPARCSRSRRRGRRRRWRCRSRCRATCRSGRSLPCRRTSRRSRGARTSPSPTNRDGRARAGRTSAATPSTSRARTARPACPRASPTNFSHRNRRTSPLCVQCSTPGPACVGRRRALLTAIGIAVRSSQSIFAPVSRIDLRPQVLLGTEIRAELGGRRADDLDADARHVVLDLVARERPRPVRGGACR